MQGELVTKQEQAKYLLESCQLDQALQVYESIYADAARLNLLNSDLLDEYAEALIGAGITDKAKEIYYESIQKFPLVNPSKYFAFAQLVCGEDAARLYLKGIELSDNKDKSAVAAAYSALAELFMTDLCDQPNAEQLCEEYITKAIKTDELCIDAYLSLSNLRLVRNNVPEAREALRKLKVLLENCGTENLPSCDFLVQACKNFIECEDFAGLEFLSELGISIDENNLELVYLHTFALAKQGSTEDALEEVQELLSKDLPPDLKEACEEVLASLSRV